MSMQLQNLTRALTRPKTIASRLLSGGRSRRLRAAAVSLAAVVSTSMVPLAQADVVVGYGDSITRGFPYRMVDLFGKREGGYIPKLENELRTLDPASNWEVHNWGFGRMNSQQATGRINEALGVNPQWVLVMIGTNDLFDGVPPSALQSNIEFIISRIRSIGAKPALATITPSYFPTQGGEAIPTLLNPRVIAAAESTNVPLNDAYSLFLPRWPELNTDGLHPNIEGYELLGQSWCDTITICAGGAGNSGLPHLDLLLLD